MSKIVLLTKEVYNRIAAGEVVERPFSVVKELVENSIDAGATEIVIKLEDGGKKLISVKDNGSGIEKDDLVNATMPHATSKIKTADDLDKIATLGFRGEALASIASVSEMKIISKVRTAEIGYYIESDYGILGDLEPFPADDGTVIEVRNLFKNTPAREKFLKPSKNEEADIVNIVTRLIFTHPEIAFKLVFDGKEKLHYAGGSIDEAIIEIYGYETIRDCIQIETEKNGLKISGFIGETYFVKPNRTYQTIVLNGRYVQNITLQTAIHNAYAPYLMKRKYPFYVLKIDVAPEFVDVNVHPNKADVRFADNHVVYGAIYSIVSKVLEGNAAAIDIVKPNGYFQTGSVVETKPVTDSENKNEENGERKYADVVGCDDPVVLPDYLTRLGKFFDPVTAEKEGLFDNLPLSSPSSGSTETETSEEKKLSIDDIFAENKKYIEELESRKSNTEKPTQTEISVDDNIRVVGQVLKTYLIFEKGEDIYFIDQHAAHERLLFDKFTEEYKNGKTDEQTLLVPFLYSVNEKEAEFLTSRFEYFRNAGIDVAEYEDGVFAVYALPLTLLDMDIKAFFDDVLSDMSFRKADMPDIIRDKLAQKACKAAIKSGKTLSQSEIDKLLEKLHGDMGLKCPHGRPIAIRITRTEIDKWFKRIV
jgi:DNA mismatch repair protein MutL